MEAVDKVLEGKYPAKEHAKRVVEYIRGKKVDGAGGIEGGVLYLEGQKTKMIEDNDGEAPFRYGIILLKQGVMRGYFALWLVFWGIDMEAFRDILSKPFVWASHKMHTVAFSHNATRTWQLDLPAARIYKT